MEKTIGIYVHIPFCRSKCPYCDFFSLPNQAAAKEYIDIVNDKLIAFTNTKNRKVDTLYIGGGTPSVLEPKYIAEVIRTAQKACQKSIFEITVECNPSDVTEEFFSEILHAGANRLSFGMQSAVDSERRALGRRADKAQVEKAVRMAQQAGFENISLDLMLGIPEQNTATLKKSIDFCADLGVQHVSAYLLKLEEGTRFYERADSLALPDEDETADLYLLAVELLEKAGFRQYEISNFAKPGFESRHNLKYWRCEEYLGIGAAAHSFLEGKRFYYPRDIDYFLSEKAPIDDGSGGDIRERIMLGLRLKEGVDSSLLSEKAKKELTFLHQQGLIEVRQNKINLTPKGFLLSNSIINLLTD